MSSTAFFCGVKSLFPSSWLLRGLIMRVCPEILDLSSILCQTSLAAAGCAQADQNFLGFSLFFFFFFSFFFIPSLLTFLVLCPLQFAPYFTQPLINWPQLICWDFPRKEAIKLFFHHLNQGPERRFQTRSPKPQVLVFPDVVNSKVFLFFFFPCSEALAVIFHPQCLLFALSKMISNHCKPKCPYL